MMWLVASWDDESDSGVIVCVCGPGSPKHHVASLLKLPSRQIAGFRVLKLT
jgi:hypothetical protein